VGLIGWPTAHSLSPAMHNAAFEALGLDWRYVPLPVQPGHLAAAVTGLRALGFRGANVTVPYKEAVLPLVTHPSKEVQELGAVNTLVFVTRARGALPDVVGENTDYSGFVAALEQAGFPPARLRHVLVVGAGGAARAVLYALRRAMIGRVTLLNRTLARAQALAASLQREGFSIEAVSLEPEALVEHARTADLLVHTTPLGMWPEVRATVWPEGVPMPRSLCVFDLVYHPLETRLLQQARAAGARAIGGLEMLVQQGARAFSFWTGYEAPLDVMRQACLQALQGVSR